MQNKNTVTVVGVILAIIVLYVAYTWRITAKTLILDISLPNIILSASAVKAAGFDEWINLHTVMDQ